jgi:hypothetical protein
VCCKDRCNACVAGTAPMRVLQGPLRCVCCSGPRNNVEASLAAAKLAPPLPPWQGRAPARAAGAMVSTCICGDLFAYLYSYLRMHAFVLRTAVCACVFLPYA